MIYDFYAQAVELVWYEVRFSATESSLPFPECCPSPTLA